MSQPEATASSAKSAAAPRRRRVWRFLFDKLRLLLFAYLVWLVVAYFAQGTMMFMPRYAGQPLPAPFLHAEVLERDLAAGNGGTPAKAQAWFLAAPEAGAAHPAPLVVILHGNAELIDQQKGITQAYLALGCNVLLPEYRGFGHSGGTPSQETIGQDALHFLQEAIKRPDVDRDRIVYHGRSLGGGVAADLVMRHQPRALILESSFTSAAGMAWRYLMPPFLVKSPFHVDTVIAAHPEMPLLLIHGRQDKVVPVSHAHALRSLSRRCTYLELQAGHNNLPGYDNEELYWNTIEAFLVGAGVKPGSAAQRARPQVPATAPAGAAPF